MSSERIIGMRPSTVCTVLETPGPTPIALSTCVVSAYGEISRLLASRMERASR